MKRGRKYGSGRAARLIPAAAIAVFVIASLASCSSRIGWGLVLWTVKGTGAKAGTIVSVYLQSNITKQYVIGIEGERDERLEVPLWQIELFRTKRAAEKRAAEMAELVSVYMIAARDGLPVRAEPTNTAKRVYRLRENEMVKALRLAEGETVYTGEERLPGDWYEVLTMDGTRGFAFSYTMRLFDENSGQVPEQKTARTDTEAINAVFSKTWRPAWYASMMEEGEVDLDYFSLRFGLFGDAINRQLRVELPAISKAFQYSAISQAKDWLVFEDTELKIKLESPSSLLASWGATTEGEPEDAAGWKAGDSFVRFILVDGDIRDAIRSEEARRADSLRRFLAAIESAGGGKGDSAGIRKFSSPLAGTFELWPSGFYSWKDTFFLPAGFPPPADEGLPEQKGTAAFGLRLSDDLARNWHGGFSLYPDSTGRRSDYVYKLEGKSLVLAKALSPAPGLHLSEIDARLGTVALDFPNVQ